MLARNRLIIALVTYALWALITVKGAGFLFPEATDLTAIVKNGIGWQFVLAIVLLVVVSLACGWRDMGHRLPREARDWRLIWLPMIFVVIFFAAALSIAPPAPATFVWIAINTLMVGISEELMFRGVLFRAFRANMGLWISVTLATLLFGSVHVLNVFLTGDLTTAVTQSIAAALSGLLFMALVLRSGSLWPAILLHWLWDFGIFLFGAAGSGAQPSQGSTGWFALLLPALLVTPNALYALYLLRKVKAD